MLQHPSLNILHVHTDTYNSLSPFIDYLHQIHHVSITTVQEFPGNLEDFHVILTDSAWQFSPIPPGLEKYVESGGVWFSLIGLSEKPIDSIFGVEPIPVGPEAELRALIQNRVESIYERLPDSFYISGKFQALDVKEEDTRTILAADWHFKHMPLMTLRKASAGYAVCTTIQDFNHSMVRNIVFRCIQKLSKISPFPDNLTVGILGYAPSVGELHGRGIEATPGLTLKAICDLNPEQLKSAAKVFPGAALYDSSEKMSNEENIDIVIIATPPNTHAALSLQMMSAGKHVVCEKPLAINRKETDLMQETSEQMKVHLSCHQNRRFDHDFLAIQQAVKENQIGDLFYMETFVGGFFHPCGHWHSHTPVSGGTAYDWGAHYLDWIVGLIPEKVEYVSGASQKRVWHDVSNSDHEQIRIKFRNNTEALFIHSDIAAIRKPKWYLLGTKGAIIGHWQDVTSFEFDPLLYFQQHDIPATEMPPDLRMTIQLPGGKIIKQKMALPPREKYPFHNNIADHLLLGEPLDAPLADSVKVVSILEAASISAVNGGKPEYI